MFCAYRVTERPQKVEGEMEADHIPPMDSLKRAEKEFNLNALKNRNKVLYDMVMMSLETPGRNKLLAITVRAHHHKGALSTGSSKESHAARYCLLPCLASF